MIGFVAHKPPEKVCGLAAGVFGPARERLIEVDIEHDTAEIEQQRVGSAGGQRKSGHRGGVRKTGEGSNGVAMPVLARPAGSILDAAPVRNVPRPARTSGRRSVRGSVLTGVFSSFSFFAE